MTNDLERHRVSIRQRDVLDGEVHDGPRMDVADSPPMLLDRPRVARDSAAQGDVIRLSDEERRRTPAREGESASTRGYPQASHWWVFVDDEASRTTRRRARKNVTRAVNPMRAQARKRVV